MHEPEDQQREATERFRHLPERIRPDDWQETTPAGGKPEPPAVRGDEVAYPVALVL